MLQLLYGFLPWILFSAILGHNGKNSFIAILVAFLVCIKVEKEHLRQKFILSWGTLLFFVILFLLTEIIKIPWVLENASMLANLSLAIIAFSSLLLGEPFTLQYAREQTHKAVWKTQGFIKVNKILTFVWGIIFLFSVALHYLKFYIHNYGGLLFPSLSYGSIILGLWFTKKFPQWFRAQRIQKLNQANPFLQENYAPIRQENDFKNLLITGQIPDNLQGVYLRNGPNPQYDPISYTYPIDGDGMLHGVYINKEVNYKNRYIRTKAFLAEQKAGKAIYGGIMLPIVPDLDLIGIDGDKGPIKNGAFIHIIGHANRYMAMSESAPAYEVNLQLETLGEWKPLGSEKPIPVGPHTRLDPKTNELYLICYDVEPPYLIYYRLDSQGHLVETKTIEKSNSTMMHDFTLTENYIIFFDCPAVFDVNAIDKNEPILQWKPELGVRIGLVPRHDKTKPILWLNTSSFFVYHFANAYEQDNKIIVHYIRHKELMLAKQIKENKERGHLYEMQIDLDKKIVIEKQISDLVAEFPTFNLAFNTLKYQYIYAPTQTQANARGFNALVKYDLYNNSYTIHDFGTHAEIEEAVFAPASGSIKEDDGYLMLFVYDKIKNMSDFVILDAQNINDKPKARIHIPRRVPHGLHGSWFATESKK